MKAARERPPTALQLALLERLLGPDGTGTGHVHQLPRHPLDMRKGNPGAYAMPDGKNVDGRAFGSLIERKWMAYIGDHDWGVTDAGRAGYRKAKGLDHG